MKRVSHPSSPLPAASEVVESSGALLTDVGVGAGAAGSRGRLGGLVARFGGTAAWTFVDQAISSLTTAILSIVIGRSVGPTDFGAFGIAFLVFTLLVGVSRAMITDPMAVLYAGRGRAEQAVATSHATALAAILGAAAGCLTVLVGLAFGHGTVLGGALICLGLGLPGLLQQDAWRYAFFMAGRPAPVAVNDAVRAVLLMALMWGVFARGLQAVPLMILVWALTAYVACGLGVLQARVAPRTRGAWAWFSGHRPLAVRLGADFAINQGAANGANMAVGPVSSLAAVGALNASRTLLGPLMLLFTGTTAVVLPAFSARSRNRLVTPVVGVSGVLAVAALAWTLVLVFLPETWGTWLLKDNWAGARTTILPTGIGAALIAFAVGPNLALKARALGGAVLRVTVVQAPLLVVLGLGGAAVGGAPGAAWGFAAAQAVGLTLTWLAYRGSERALPAERDEPGVTAARAGRTPTP